MLEIVAADDDPRGLELSGELDLATTPALIERAAPLAEDDGDLSLDLSGVRFIDSQGIRGFIRIAHALEGRGRLRLVRPSEEIRKLFEIVRVDDFPNITVEA
jgi:anti-anti-sigma factor